MKKIVLVGGGGHCKSVIDSIVKNNEYEIVGITDPLDKGSVLNINLLGDDDLLPGIYASGVEYAFVTLGSVGNTRVRRKLHEFLKGIGYKIPVICDSSAIVSPFTEIGEGTFIGKGAIVNVHSKIGCESIINSGVILEHDCTIGDFVHLAPGTVLSGGVTVGDDSHIGTASKVIEGISIGKNVMVGAGTVIVKNFEDNVKVFGNPGRIRWKKFL